MRRILQGKSFDLIFSCDEVYCTNALFALINIVLCSKLHCQKFFELKLFSYKIGRSTDSGTWRNREG